MKQSLHPLSSSLYLPLDSIYQTLKLDLAGVEPIMGFGVALMIQNVTQSLFSTRQSVVPPVSSLCSPSPRVTAAAAVARGIKKRVRGFF